MRILTFATSASPKDSPARPYDASASDALWDLAPEGTLFGVIAAPGSGLRAHEMVREILRVVEARPLGKTTATQLLMQLLSDIGFDPFELAELKKQGIDLSLGAALFATNGDKKYGVFPVSDREAFRAMAGGKIESVEGIEFDRYKDDLTIAVPRGLAKEVGTEKPSAMYSVRVPTAVWESRLLAEEDQILPNGLSMHKDILGNLSGEFAIFAGSGDSL